MHGTLQYFLLRHVQVSITRYKLRFYTALRRLELSIREARKFCLLVCPAVGECGLAEHRTCGLYFWAFAHYCWGRKLGLDDLMGEEPVRSHLLVSTLMMTMVSPGCWGMSHYAQLNPVIKYTRLSSSICFSLLLTSSCHCKDEKDPVGTCPAEISQAASR